MLWAVITTWVHWLPCRVRLCSGNRCVPVGENPLSRLPWGCILSMGTGASLSVVVLWLADYLGGCVLSMGTGASLSVVPHVLVCLLNKLLWSPMSITITNISSSMKETRFQWKLSGNSNSKDIILMSNDNWLGYACILRILEWSVCLPSFFLGGGFVGLWRNRPLSTSWCIISNS